jgi:hypothetical protein
MTMTLTRKRDKPYSPDEYLQSAAIKVWTNIHTKRLSPLSHCPGTASKRFKLF